MDRSLLDLIHALATGVSSGARLDDVLGPMLRGLHDRVGLDRAMLALVDPVDGRLRVEAAHGLTPAETRRIAWSPGEGVVGRSVDAGEPTIVPRISASEVFADKFRAREHGLDGAFLCVPVRSGAAVLGAISAWRMRPDEADLHADRRLLEVMAALLVPVVEQRDRLPSDGRASGAPRPRNLIGRSKRMEEVYELVARVAPSSTTVLLRGESGTGKELVARALHDDSPRSRAPFVKVNCAALPASIIESELFGHERGSFTGATDRRKGRFELADGGTIFLDEIGDLAPETQIKLLRVLQEREFERVGSAVPIEVDVRVIAATSRDLESMLSDGSFRADLYYRLNVFPIRLPALRDRRADILLLADHFLEQFARSHGKAIGRIATSAIDLLMSYHWPGNVRELENGIERAVLLARGDVLMAHHLPPSLQAPTSRPDGISDGGLQATLDAIERDLVVDALKAHRGNMAACARSLEITERQMGLRVRRHGIDPRRYKQHRSDVHVGHDQ